MDNNGVIPLQRFHAGRTAERDYPSSFLLPNDVIVHKVMTNVLERTGMYRFRSKKNIFSDGKRQGIFDKLGMCEFSDVIHNDSVLKSEKMGKIIQLTVPVQG